VGRLDLGYDESFRKMVMGRLTSRIALTTLLMIGTVCTAEEIEAWRTDYNAYR
jgi:hypothetical protein